MENTQDHFAGILDKHRDQIAACWTDLIMQMPDSHYKNFRKDDTR